MQDKHDIVSNTEIINKPFLLDILGAFLEQQYKDFSLTPSEFLLQKSSEETQWNQWDQWLWEKTQWNKYSGSYRQSKYNDTRKYHSTLLWHIPLTDLQRDDSFCKTPVLLLIDLPAELATIGYIFFQTEKRSKINLNIWV